MTHQQLKKLQNIQRTMLADFHLFCTEHSLRYYMFYGTLLGAVRHKGFIPWDYDIDIVMTRAEYNKFLDVKHLLPSHLWIWDVCYSTIDFGGLARIMFKDDELGNIHIDIFILDYEKTGVAYRNPIVQRICTLLHLSKLSKSEKSILLKHFSKQLSKRLVIHVAKLVNILFGGSNRIERMIYKIRVSPHPSGYYITLEDGAHFPIKYFSKPELMDFDGHKFYAPSNIHELLTIMYGDYMRIPPEEQKWLKEEGIEQIPTFTHNSK